MKIKIMSRVTLASLPSSGCFVQLESIIGAHVAVFLAVSAVPEVLRFTRQTAPMSPMSTVSRARRLSLWFFTLFFHSLNTILCVLKVEVNPWKLLIKCYTSASILVVSIGLLVLLRQIFPLRQYFWMVGGTFVIICALSVMLAMSSSQSAIVLEIINIPLTLLVNILHFSCQEGFFRFKLFSWFVAVLGTCSAILSLAEFKLSACALIASVINGLFRYLDVVLIAGYGRDKGNYFLLRFNEFFI